MARARRSGPCHHPPAMSDDLEPKVHHERVGEPAKIDRRSASAAAREPLIGRQLAFSRLIANLAADPDRPDWHPHAAENHRPRGGAFAHEVAAKDRGIAREKLSRLAVPVPEDTDTAA